MDILLGYSLGNQDSVCVYFLSLSNELFARNLGTHVVRNYVLESLKTEVSVEALHLNDSVDTYGMSVGFDGSAYYYDVSADVLADPLAALYTVHNGSFYLRNVDSCEVDGLLCGSVYYKEGESGCKFMIVCYVGFKESKSLYILLSAFFSFFTVRNGKCECKLHFTIV